MRDVLAWACRRAGLSVQVEPPLDAVQKDRGRADLIVRDLANNGFLVDVTIHDSTRKNQSYALDPFLAAQEQVKRNHYDRFALVHRLSTLPFVLDVGGYQSEHARSFIRFENVSLNEAKLSSLEGGRAHFLATFSWAVSAAVHVFNHSAAEMSVAALRRSVLGVPDGDDEQNPGGGGTGSGDGNGADAAGHRAADLGASGAERPPRGAARAVFSASASGRSRPGQSRHIGNAAPPGSRPAVLATGAQVRPVGVPAELRLVLPCAGVPPCAPSTCVPLPVPGVCEPLLAFAPVGVCDGRDVKDGLSEVVCCPCRSQDDSGWRERLGATKVEGALRSPGGFHIFSSENRVGCRSTGALARWSGACGKPSRSRHRTAARPHRLPAALLSLQ